MTAKNAEFTLNSWEGADRCLREIAECEIALNGIEAQMNMSINDAKERTAELGKPMKARIKILEVLIKDFAEVAKADMEGKSKQLNFGRIGFRRSSSVVISPKKLDAILNNLKKFDMEDCILTKESINKEVLEPILNKLQ